MADSAIILNSQPIRRLPPSLLFLWCLVINRMLRNQFPHLKFYCLQLKMCLNYPLIEDNKTSNGENDYVTFYSLQDIKGKEQKNSQPIWLLYSDWSIAFPRWQQPSDWLRIQYGGTISQSEGHFHVGKVIDQSEEGLCLQFTPPPPHPPGAERSYFHYSNSQKVRTMCIRKNYPNVEKIVQLCNSNPVWCSVKQTVCLYLGQIFVHIEGCHLPKGRFSKLLVKNINL